jgi:hypothetical protein
MHKTFPIASRTQIVAPLGILLSNNLSRVVSINLLTCVFYGDSNNIFGMDQLYTATHFTEL